ncbi:hemerythrin domain-containing protein [Cellulosimicrobium sp. Marseille-Q8652]
MAWYDEMRAVHGRLRRALDLVRETATADEDTTTDEDPASEGPATDPASDGPAADASGRPGPRAPHAAHAELLVYCRGFCTALTRHHTSEDSTLFPELERRHPELGATLRALRQDHSMIAYLVGDLEQTLDRAADPASSRDAVLRHLDGVGAIMESHFRYEERALGDVLAALDLVAERDDVLGPF